MVKKESTWPRSIPPRKKKEKDVFRFLKEHDSNYTVRTAGVPDEHDHGEEQESEGGELLGREEEVRADCTCVPLPPAN